jgi:hypothetical protein
MTGARRVFFTYKPGGGSFREDGTGSEAWLIV